MGFDGVLFFVFLPSAHVYHSTRCGRQRRIYPMSFIPCVQFLFVASRAHNCTKLFHCIIFESTPACSSHTPSGNSITRTSNAASALASLLSNLTALRILDISGAVAPVMFNSSLIPTQITTLPAFRTSPGKRAPMTSWLPPSSRLRCHWHVFVILNR